MLKQGDLVLDSSAKRKPPPALLVAFRGVADANARGGGELDARVVAFNPKSVGRNKVFTVERAVDLEKFRQPARAFRSLDAANEDGLGTPFRAGHNIQHFVHPVAKIDVSAAASGIHYICSRRPSLMRMAGGILFSAIGLCLGNASPHDSAILQPTTKPRANQRLRRRHRVNRIVIFGQTLQSNLRLPVVVCPSRQAR